MKRALAIVGALAAVSALAACAHHADSSWQEGADGWGRYTNAEYGFCVDMPGQPIQGEASEPDGTGAGDEASDSPKIRLYVEGEDATWPAYMINVEETTPQQRERLGGMTLDEQASELYWYAAGFVGSEELLGGVEAAQLGDHAGVRYSAPTYHDATLWSVLSDEAVITLVAYGDEDADRVFDSLSFDCGA